MGLADFVQQKKMEATFCQLMDPRLGIITLTTPEVYLLEVYLDEPSFNANISNRESWFVVVKSLLCWMFYGKDNNRKRWQIRIQFRALTRILYQQTQFQSNTYLIITSWLLFLS